MASNDAPKPRHGAALGALTLLSCKESLEPTRPDANDNQPIAPEFAWASNSWQMRAPMPSRREDLALGVATNSAGQAILYAISGFNPVSFSDVVPSIEAYNYTTNTWTTKTAKFAGSQTNGVGVIGGKLYISGGWGPHTGEGRTIQKTLYVYDPVADVVTRKADMPRPTVDGITGVINGKLYVLTGGCDCAEFISRRFYRYDPATNSWAFLPWAPRAHLDGVGGVINGKFYVAGGSSGTMITGNLDVYDPATNRWSARASMPKAVTQAAGAVLNNKLYVIGGAAVIDGPHGPAPQSVRMVHAYDPSTNTWQTKASLPTARHRLAAATVTAFGNFKILAIGGVSSSDPDSKAHTVNEAYKP